MSHQNARPAPPLPESRINGWDRAAILGLGAAGCALSYDALVQMAGAIHVRGVLRYLFPLVIDGFIGYGVRALVVLRAAPLRARLYAWSLFGGATAASIWANALHAVRLNQTGPGTGVGLRLGDLTVGALSTLAPLALAGAVHLYILIARHLQDTADGLRGADRTARGPVTGQVSATDVRTADTAGRPALTERFGRRRGRLSGREASRGQDVAGRLTAHSDPPPDRGQPDGPSQRTDPTTPTADVRPEATTATTAGHPSTGASGPAADHRDQEPAATERDSSTPDTPAVRPGRPAKPAIDELLPIARRAVTDSGRVSRAVVAQAIRGQGVTLSNQRLTVLMQHLREPPAPGAFRR